MDCIKRFVTCHIPVSACNFKCTYCYIGQLKYSTNKVDEFVLSPDEIAKKMSVKRMGGICYFNLCGNGETMLHPQLVSLVNALIKEGHYVDIITNGTVSKRFDELLSVLTETQQQHLFIKFSFHWDELKRTKQMDSFLSNVDKIKKSNVSYTIEITPHDELIPQIKEIKEFSFKHFGALPHITVTRNEATEEIELLSALDRVKYRDIWSQFDSALFDFKFRIFNQKRKEFCHAGDWSIELDLSSGVYKQCYKGAVLGNIRENKPMHFLACGKCPMPHCFNGHAFLAYGNIPELETPTYCAERNRLTTSNEYWLKEECQLFFKTKVYNNNPELNESQKKRAIFCTNYLLLVQKMKKLLKEFLRQ